MTSRFEQCVCDVTATTLKNSCVSTLIEVPSSKLNISVYIIDLNSLRFPFVVILQTKPHVMFLFFYSVDCTVVLPNGTNVLTKKSNAPLMVINACVP